MLEMNPAIAAVAVRSIPCTLMLCFGQVASAQAPATQAPLIIPGTVHKWRTPEMDLLPETTIQEMGECMNISRSLRTRAPELDRRQAQLETDSANLNSGSAALQKSSAAIDADQAAHARAVAALNAASPGLEKRGQEIDALVAKPAATPAAAKKANEAVTRFNADIASWNKQRDSLLRAGDSLELRILEHNRAVDAANLQADQFNARNAELNRLAGEYNSELARYKAACGGERSIRD